MRLLSEADVQSLIDPKLAIDAAETAFRRHAQNGGDHSGRLNVESDQPRFRALVLTGADEVALSLKLNLHAYSAGSGASEAATHRSASILMIWDTEYCRPRGLIAAAAFNDHRTAAGFAVAAQLLAPADARTLSVFGAGKIAGPAIEYISLVRPIEQVIIKSRDGYSAERLAAGLRAGALGSRMEFTAEPTPAQAAEEADVLVSVTTSHVPVFPGTALRPGRLAILGGANHPERREADDNLARRADFYTDDEKACLSKAGDVRLALESGALRRDAMKGEIGRFLNGEAAIDPARGDRVRVFKSTGIPLQDIVLGEALLKRADELGRGLTFDPIGESALVA